MQRIYAQTGEEPPGACGFPGAGGFLGVPGGFLGAPGGFLRGFSGAEGFPGAP